MGEGTRRGVPPLGPERRPLAQAPRDPALDDRTLDDRTLDTPAVDTSAVDTPALVTPAAGYNRITEATEGLTAEDLTSEVLPPEDAAPEDSDLTPRPFDLFTRHASFLTHPNPRPI